MSAVKAFPPPRNWVLQFPENGFPHFGKLIVFIDNFIKALTIYTVEHFVLKTLVGFNQNASGHKMLTRYSLLFKCKSGFVLYLFTRFMYAFRCMYFILPVKNLTKENNSVRTSHVFNEPRVISNRMSKIEQKIRRTHSHLPGV